MFFSTFQTATELFVWAFVAHLAADWLFQTEWMVIHKVNLRHPAGYVHATVYALFMALVFPPLIALLIGVTHLLVDTRARALVDARRQAHGEDSPGTGAVEMGVDQVFHIMVIAFFALMLRCPDDGQPIAYIPMDRRQALVRPREFPDRTQGAALFADISGFTR